MMHDEDIGFAQGVAEGEKITIAKIASMLGLEFFEFDDVTTRHKLTMMAIKALIASKQQRHWSKVTPLSWEMSNLRAYVKQEEDYG